jgi:hypothetical protein
MRQPSSAFFSSRVAAITVLAVCGFALLVSKSWGDAKAAKGPKSPPTVSGPRSDMFKPKKSREKGNKGGPNFYIGHPELLTVPAANRDGSCQPVGYGCGSCCTNGQVGALWLNADCSWACDACTNGETCAEGGPAYAETAIAQSRSELACVKMRPGQPGAFVLANACQTCMKVILLWNFYDGTVKMEERTMPPGQVQAVPMNNATRCETLSERGC